MIFQKVNDIIRKVDDKKLDPNQIYTEGYPQSYIKMKRIPMIENYD